METANTVIAVFSDHQAAETAVKKLNAAGFEIKNLSVVGKGYHTDEKVVGFYNVGDQVKFWGTRGAFWGGLKTILGTANPSRLDVHSGAKAAAPAGDLVHANG